MTITNAEDLRYQIGRCQYVVVHCDAAWNRHAEPMRKQIDEAKRRLESDVSFCEIDIDLDHELARSLEVKNVPALTYFKDGRLIKTVVGLKQDVAGCIAGL
ncbi:MAG: thioredoxin family protein [Planctomycetota bacterium]